MMVALLEGNQGAFLNGDMNQMLVGSVLEMPATVAASAIGRADALAMVREQIEFQGADPQPQPVTEEPETAPEVVADSGEDNSSLPIATPVDGEDASDETEAAAEQSPGLSIVGVDETTTGDSTPATDEVNAGTDLSRDLDDVNRRVQLAQEELASPVEEVTEPEATAEETQARIKEMQEKISDEATLAQDRIAAQADADKNLAAAEAEAQRIRLANEEDELKLQLATLRRRRLRKIVLRRDSKMRRPELVLKPSRKNWR